MTANQINYAKYVEDQRHNLAMEQEQQRANKATEKIKQQEATTNEKKVLSSAEAMLVDVIKSFLGKNGDEIVTNLTNGTVTIEKAAEKAKEIADSVMGNTIAGKVSKAVDEIVDKGSDIGRDAILWTNEKIVEPVREWITGSKNDAAEADAKAAAERQEAKTKIPSIWNTISGKKGLKVKSK